MRIMDFFGLFWVNENVYQNESTNHQEKEDLMYFYRTRSEGPKEIIKTTKSI